MGSCKSKSAQSADASTDAARPAASASAAVKCTNSVRNSNLLQAAAPISRRESIMSAESTRTAFREFDKNHSGCVEQDEARAVLQRELFYDDEQIDKLFSTFDRNKDRRLSYDEFVDFYAVVSERKAELLEIFEKIDKDKSGKISAEELFTVLLPFQFSEQQIRDMVSLHDVDQDGYLEFEEFVKFWKYSSTYGNVLASSARTQRLSSMSADRAKHNSVVEGGKLNMTAPETSLKNAFKESGKVTTVMACHGQGSEREQSVEIRYVDAKVIGNGSFGVVYQARLMESNEMVAIKKVLQDKRFKNRELQIMQKLEHHNIVKLRYYFYSTGEKKDEVYLSLVLEFVPETVYRVMRNYTKNKQSVPTLFVKLYTYQLMRSLAYIHALGICHRDIKPQNLLLDPESGILKLCDFGSAKQLVRGEPNVSYICSRYYRAPELIFGATDYSTQIDVWSAGCVLGELMLGQPMFPGDSGVDQLVEIIKVLGTPTREQICDMNPNYQEFKFPQIKSHPWPKVFPSRSPPEAMDLIGMLLTYTPLRRLTPIEACAHVFFNELREEGTRMPSGRPLPQLFNFTPLELAIKPSLEAKLIPAFARRKQQAAGSEAPSASAPEASAD